MRPIDADALMELYDFPPEYAEALSVPLPIVVQNILDMPTLDYAQVRHGKLNHIGFLTCQCSECKKIFHELPCENYRPNCGAKMDGKENGKDDNN